MSDGHVWEAYAPASRQLPLYISHFALHSWKIASPPIAATEPQLAQPAFALHQIACEGLMQVV